MDFSEYDFWWLVCCKKRNFPDSHIYVYEPNMDEKSPKRIMAECYGIKLMTPDMVVKNDCFKKYNKFVMDKIQLDIKNNEGEH